jgi:hypothetical protein
MGQEGEEGESETGGTEVANASESVECDWLSSENGSVKAGVVSKFNSVVLIEDLTSEVIVSSCKPLEVLSFDLKAELFMLAH